MGDIWGRFALCIGIALAGCDSGGGGATPPAPDTGPTLDAGPDADLPDADLDQGLDAEPDAFVIVDAEPPPLGAADEVWRVYAGFNDIPVELLGYAPDEDDERQVFQWMLPPDGWPLSVTVLHGDDWQPSEPPYLLLRGIDPFRERQVIDTALLDPPGGTWTPINRGHVWRAGWGQVDLGETPLGTWSLQAVVDEVVGRPLRFDVAELTPERDPFPAVDPWGVRLDRDESSLTVAYAGTFDVSIDPTPDGVPDVEEALAAVGMLGGDESWRAAVMGLFREKLLAQLREFFLLDPRTGAVGPDSVPIQITLQGEPDAPPVEEWAMLGWSAIAVGGLPPPEDPGLFGRAALDWNNQAPNDNTGPGRGVFSTTFVRVALSNRVITSLILDYVPAAGGQPFGSLPGDDRLLDLGVQLNELPEDLQVRANRFRFLLDSMSLAVAAVTAHEIGHSLGLVKEGVPPRGMLAGVQGPWAVAVVDGSHVDTRGFNLMQPGSAFSFTDALTTRPRFNDINLAYLRRRLILLP
ncbi:MAG: hypothetical protein KC549_07965 [Myxococcales bacterium]|nr:hypothetical protein [Myxococcales bacterium]